MNLPQILFYAIAVLILTATAFAVTRRNMVYAVIYLVLSFFGSAMLFYLLGAPFLAALEIIIYAGAIMVLFLFIIIMVQFKGTSAPLFSRGRLIPAVLISVLFLAAFGVLALSDSGGWAPFALARVLPKTFGVYLFHAHGLAIEIASMLLFVALVAAIVLGRRGGPEREADAEEGKP